MFVVLLLLLHCFHRFLLQLWWRPHAWKSLLLVFSFVVSSLWPLLMIQLLRIIWIFLTLPPEVACINISVVFIFLTSANIGVHVDSSRLQHFVFRLVQNLAVGFGHSEQAGFFILFGLACRRRLAVCIHPLSWWAAFASDLLMVNALTDAEFLCWARFLLPVLVTNFGIGVEAYLIKKIPIFLHWLLLCLPAQVLRVPLRPFLKQLIVFRSLVAAELGVVRERG